jgi:hypothetical protein
MKTKEMDASRPEMQNGRLPYVEPQSSEIDFELEGSILDISGNLPEQPGENWDN